MGGVHVLDFDSEPYLWLSFFGFERDWTRDLKFGIFGCFDMDVNVGILEMVETGEY